MRPWSETRRYHGASPQAFYFVAWRGSPPRPGCVARSTAFADDVRIGQEVRSVEDFLNAMVRLGHVLQLLVDARMMINTTKSVILLSVPQSYAKKWRRREIVSDQDGSKLRVSTVSTGTFHLPIVESHKYLGAVITSPDECSQLTVFYRLHQASAAWSRLRPALTSASVPALPLRLRLWRACIPPTALYALDSLPLTPGQITQVQQYLTRQLRALARSQAHTMLETTLGLHKSPSSPYGARNFMEGCRASTCPDGPCFIRRGLSGEP